MLTQQQEKRTLVLLAFGVLMIGANLRAPLTAIGSLIPNIQQDLLLTSAVAGAITTIPLLAFALFSPFAPRLAESLGMEKVIFYSMIALLIGVIVRSFPSTPLLFAGTILIGLAIAIGNVLIPAFIKLKFPYKIGLMTGLYAVFMNVAGALSSGLSVPLALNNPYGWAGALAAWSVIIVFATILWIPQLRANEPIEATPTTEKAPSMLRSPIAWSVTIFMGVQSLLFYTMVAWLPAMLKEHGYTQGQGGWMLFLLQIIIVVSTFIVPIIADKMSNQIVLSLSTVSFFLFGFVGLLTPWVSLIPLWVTFIGIGSGSAFSLAMMFFNLRTKTVKEASQLSGMAQSIGYLIAAIGPMFIGKLFDLTNSWTLPLYVLIGCSILLLLVSVNASRERTI